MAVVMAVVMAVAMAFLREAMAMFRRRPQAARLRVLAVEPSMQSGLGFASSAALL